MVTLATAVGVTTRVVVSGTPFAVTVIVTDFAAPTAVVDAVYAVAVLPRATTWLSHGQADTLYESCSAGSGRVWLTLIPKLTDA